MLSRANKNYAAQNPAAASATRPVQKAKIEQALPASSSPRNGTIADYCKPSPMTTAKASRNSPASSFRRFPSSSSVTAHLTASTNVLNIRSPNNSTVVSLPSAKGSSVVALCNTHNSFLENPLVSEQPQTSNIKIQQAGESDLLAYGIDPDDFTDDENLGLDLKSPCALPAPQLLSSTEKRPGGTTETRHPNMRSSLSWPSSSPSHHLPPPSRLFSTATSLQKRNALNDPAPLPLPAAKKRTLPKHWSKSEDEQFAVDGVDRAHVAATPAAKQKDVLLWDASASAVKAQRKQLKDSHKKPTPGAAAPESHEDGSYEPPKKAVSLSKPSAPATVILSTEQEHVKNLVCIKHKSVFFTGPAGTGKSILMKAIIADLKTRYEKRSEKLGITASTGLAACNIGGMTLHSFSGIGLGKEDVQTLVKKIRRNPKAKERWLKTKVLVIDEISMVDGDLFDKLSNIGRIIRNNGRPWGGIQLVLTGDFFQLPPVPGRESRDIKFAFEAATWNTSIDHTIGLSEVFRQKDPEFADMLNEMRLGHISEKTVQTFKSLSRPIKTDDGIEVTELFPTRTEVDSSNEKRLRALTGKPQRYDAFDTGDPDKREKVLQNMMAPKSLVLREGAQVMLIKNMDETLVNGSLGTVVKFMTESDYELFGDDLDQLELEDPAADVKRRAAMLKQYINKGDDGSGSRKYPYVRFHISDGSQRGILVRQEEWKVELPTGEIQASRHQLPLILAWALSIHKAQGQTLERVKVDLGRVFEKGQAYVALSRATSKEGLQVLRFEKHKVMAHPRVISFYSKLYSAESALKSGGNLSILAFARKTELKLDPGNSLSARRG